MYWQIERSFLRDLRQAKRNGAPNWVLNPLAFRYLKTKHMQLESKKNENNKAIKEMFYDHAVRELSDLHILLLMFEHQRIGSFEGYNIRGLI